MPGGGAVFLDRDGVINRSVVRDGKPYPPDSLDKVEIIPGAAKSLIRLSDAGYLLIGVTNQPDVAKGTQTRDVVEAIIFHIQSILPVKAIFTCYHDDQDNCPCRKPKPGLILEAAKIHEVNLAASWMVGDRWKDVAAGQAAGVRTVFVDYGYTENYQALPADFVIKDMLDLADVILNSEI